jgi:hypothetical protein
LSAGPIDVAQDEGHVDVRPADRVERDDDVRRVRGARALEGHDGIPDLEFGHPALTQRRVRLVGYDIDGVPADKHGLRVGVGRYREVIAEEADDAGHRRPIVVGGDQAGVRPILGERDRLCSRVRADRQDANDRDEEDGDQSAGGSAAAMMVDRRHGEFSSWKPKWLR